MGVTEILSQEHQVVLQKLALMEKALDPLEIGPIDEVLTFMETDLGLHRRKEEEVLFPLLGRHIGVDQGPIACMLEEHATERGLMADLRAALRSAREGKDVTGRIRRSAGGILDLLRAHIEKEDQILFPLAERTLVPDEQSQLDREMKKIGTFCQEMSHE